MFLTTKLNLLSGMIVGASAVLFMKETCKGRCKQKHEQRNKSMNKTKTCPPMEPEQNIVSNNYTGSTI